MGKALKKRVLRFLRVTDTHAPSPPSWAQSWSTSYAKTASLPHFQYLPRRLGTKKNSSKDCFLLRSRRTSLSHRTFSCTTEARIAATASRACARAARVRKRRFCCAILLRQNQNVHHFTKTGSGQTYARESTQKESGGSGALVPLCAPYKKEFCVHTTATLERRRVFAVLAFNKDLIGGNADRNLEPCRRYSAAMVAAGGRPPPLDERGLEAASMLYARPAFASIGVAKNENTPSVACPDYSLSRACLGKSSFNLSRACLGKSSLKKPNGVVCAVPTLPACRTICGAGGSGFDRGIGGARVL